MTHLVVRTSNLCRPQDERTRLELTFRDAVLNYCTSPNLLLHWQKVNHDEYREAYLRGLWACNQLLTDRELNRVRYTLTFED